MIIALSSCNSLPPPTKKRNKYFVEFFLRCSCFSSYAIIIICEVLHTHEKQGKCHCYVHVQMIAQASVKNVPVPIQHPLATVQRLAALLLYLLPSSWNPIQRSSFTSFQVHGTQQIIRQARLRIFCKSTQDRPCSWLSGQFFRFPHTQDEATCSRAAC